MVKLEPFLTNQQAALLGYKVIKFKTNDTYVMKHCHFASTRIFSFSVFYCQIKHLKKNRITCDKYNID